MNYLYEINAFERWLETNYLPTGSQLLWYKLIGLFNRCGWQEWIVVDNRTLMALMQIKRTETFVDLRNKLIEAELIEYNKGWKGSPNKYRLISFEKETVSKTVLKSEPKTVLKSGLKNVPQNVLKTGDIYKQNKTKQNKKSSSSNILATVDKLTNQKSEEEEKILKVLETYKANVNLLPSPIEVEHIRDWLNEVEPDVIIMAVETAVLNNGRSLNYIKRVIDNWICQGLTTGEQVKAYLENWERNRNGAKDTKLKVICGNKQDEQQAEFLAKIEERKKRLMLDDDATM